MDPFGSTVSRPASVFVQPVTDLTVDEFHLQVHCPQALNSIGAGGNEVIQGLPPYKLVQAYPIAGLSNVPVNWAKDVPGVRVFALPLELGLGQKEFGLWLNLNDAFRHPSHDVACKLSVKGADPFTLKRSDTVLRNFVESPFCPEPPSPQHPLQHLVGNRYCPICQREYPPQDFLSTKGTQYPLMWRDGTWESTDVVRQWVFTMCRSADVATAAVGAVNTTNSIAVAFYRSVSPKPMPKWVYLGGGVGVPSGPLSRCYGRSTARVSEVFVKAGARVRQPDPRDEVPLSYWGPCVARIIIELILKEEWDQLLATQPSPPSGALAGLGIPLGHRS
jgi:hypothetical protein